VGWSEPGAKAMDVMFTLVPIFMGVVFLLVLAGVVVHTVMFGKLFGSVFKRVADVAAQQQKVQAALEPKACAYCGASFPAGTADCPSCGGKR
jgi:hypothetical protein